VTRRSVEAIVEALNARDVRYLIAGGLAVVAQRHQWTREKGLTVFSLYSPEHPATEVDVFMEAPLPSDICPLEICIARRTDPMRPAARADVFAMIARVLISCPS
jgi:hypothetical protein